MKRTRVILADDHTLLLETFRSFLQPEFDIVGTFADGMTLVEGAAALDPDVVVLDIGMPVMNGLNAAQRLGRALPAVKLIFLTMNQDPELFAEAFRLGASGYLLKTSAASELPFAIREAMLGKTFVTPLIARPSTPFFQKAKHKKTSNKLTLRQKEVLQLLAEGRTMKEVAHRLDVTPRTIAFHKYTMMEQLHLKSSAELVQFAMRISLLSG